MDKILKYLSMADWVWRLVSGLVVVSGGTVSALVARMSPMFTELGPWSWVSVGILSSLIIALALYLVRLADKHRSETLLNEQLTQVPTSINPLLPNFTDAIIKIEDLRLPGKMIHQNKQFKRCKFVGPGAIAVHGGNYTSTGFYNCGSIVVLPDKTMLTGLPLLNNCTVDECEFHTVSVFVSKPVGIAMKQSIPGIDIAGLNE